MNFYHPPPYLQVTASLSLKEITTVTSFGLAEEF